MWVAVITENPAGHAHRRCGLVDRQLLTDIGTSTVKVGVTSIAVSDGVRRTGYCQSTCGKTGGEITRHSINRCQLCHSIQGDRDIARRNQRSSLDRSAQSGGSIPKGNRRSRQVAEGWRRLVDGQLLTVIVTSTVNV